MRLDKELKQRNDIHLNPRRATSHAIIHAAPLLTEDSGYSQTFLFLRQATKPITALLR
jgi:hypothetical protein